MKITSLAWRTAATDRTIIWRQGWEARRFGDDLTNSGSLEMAVERLPAMLEQDNESFMHCYPPRKEIDDTRRSTKSSKIWRRWQL
jgi:hypothetical protein